MPTDTLRPTPRPLRHGPEHLREDILNYRAGILDWKSFISGWMPAADTVETICRDPDGKLKKIIRSHNLRTTMGRDQWQRLTLAGNISANSSFATARGAVTSATATSMTAATGFPTTGGPNTGLQGQIVVCMTAAGTTAVYGVILANTATVLTVDQWYDPTSATGAAGTTPTSSYGYVVMPGAGPSLWMGLSTNSAAAAAGDVLRTADGLFADGTTGAAATEATVGGTVAAPGLQRAFVQPTFSAGAYVLTKTYTYTGSTLQTFFKAVLCNSLPAAGSLLFLETLLSSSASVSTNGDTIQNTWTVNL